jgi:hypothetical protein
MVILAEGYDISSAILVVARPTQLRRVATWVAV